MLTPRHIDKILALVLPITGLFVIAFLLLTFREELTLFEWATAFVKKDTPAASQHPPSMLGEFSSAKKTSHPR